MKKKNGTGMITKPANIDDLRPHENEKGDEERAWDAVIAPHALVRQTK